MAGVEERVQAFLNSWLKVREQLEEVLKDDERLLHSRGVGRSLPGESKDLQDCEKDIEWLRG
jgi:hypothetical protein